MVVVEDARVEDVLDDGRVDELGVDVPEVVLGSGAPSPRNRA